MSGIAMGSKDGDFMALLLQGYGGIDDQSFCASDAEVGMKDNDILLFEL
jgi:hypothetical protein